MPLSRPALEVLGISPSFARTHHQKVVVAVAEAIYRTAAGRYHADKGDDAVPLPSAVNLTEMQEARDAVRNDPSSCIKAVQKSERVSKEGKQAKGLTEQILTFEELENEWSLSTTALLEYIARQKLGLTTGEEIMGTKVVAFNTLHLNGVAILVSVTEQSKSVLYEYLRHKGTWFKRPVVKTSFSKKSPCPPNIPSELVVEGSTGPEQGYFYDQSGPHEELEGFDILGSYTRNELSVARAKKNKARGQKPDVDDRPAIVGQSILQTDATMLDPLVASVLKLYVSAGSILQSITRKADGSVRYVKAGNVVMVRVFDQKQRP